MPLNKHSFTLLEVVIAIALLALSFVSAMGITVTAAKRMMKAVSRWEEQHMLNQAVEYYLLAGPKANIPQEFFPYEGYRAECTVEPAELPEDVESEVGAWRFVKLKITIYNEENQPVNSLIMDKFFRAEDIE